MTTARSQLIFPDITPYYHCVSRCVRRSFLCGQDPLTGQCYEHRKTWVEERILVLGEIYCIDICAYAVMSNHYHLVVRIDQKTAQSLSAADIIARWRCEHHLPPLIERYLTGALSNQTELNLCNEIIEIWRSRLGSLSWFMKELNYDIAVQANREDECTGRFWEGRFKSQALLDEKALLAAMAYVDLNPVRARVADAPEQSEHTSIKARLDCFTQGRNETGSLASFVGYQPLDNSDGIPFRFMDYLELLDWIGKQIRHDGKGHIAQHLPAILQRLSLTQPQCLSLCTQLETKSRRWIGGSQPLRIAKQSLNRQRMVGLVIT